MSFFKKDDNLKNDLLQLIHEDSYCCSVPDGTQACIRRTDNKYFSALALGLSECDL